MNELIFRGKDRFSPDLADLALLLMVITAEVLAGRMKFHFGPGLMILLVGGTVLLVAGSRLIAMRYLVRVNADGVTVSWGLGRGRTYSWQQISWIDVSEIQGRGTTTRVARIHTTDGRRHWLSTLVTSGFNPSEDFDADFRRVVDWWKHSTSPSRRVRPEKQFRDKITPTKIGVVGTVVFAVILFVATVVL
ncbi:PH domain-containing protein [Kitasatospora sp. NPDC101235]|uniref:PH domain-containing protein n=1 Tax=Kitasatospora sp. NPDC101235 TaxID=3364101 RepID=UPI0037F19576